MRPLDPVKIEPDAWCEWCGDPLPEPEERHPKRRFCCRECKDALRYDELSQARRELRPERTCDHCGVAFRAKNTGQRFCSDSCTQKARYRRDRGLPETEGASRPCATCGNAMHRPALDKIYCSPKCYLIAKMRRARAKG